MTEAAEASDLTYFALAAPAASALHAAERRRGHFPSAGRFQTE